MNEVRQSNGPIYVGLFIALIVHLIIAGPVLSASWGVGRASPLDSSLDGSSEAERRQRERLEKALKEMQDAPPPEDDLVKPGLDDGSDQGMAWIGYAEYQEHLARHAETDQAAFTDKETGGGGAPAQGAPEQAPPVPSEPGAQQPPTPPTPEQAQPSPEPAQRSPPPAPPTSPPVPEIQLPVAPVGPEGTLPLVQPPTPPAPPEQPQPQAQIQPQPPSQPQPETQPQQPTPQQPQPQATQGATAPTVAPVPGPPGAQGPSDAQGDRSDRESDATSIVDAPPSKWRNGKPLAQKGLEIITRKPELPILTRLTTSPGNPICEIIFDKSGKPVTCKILLSSGTEDVDGPVLDALYRWRARGEQLQKLAPGKTLTFRVRFILN